jgi:ABC-2 type transport system permease protein
MKLLRLWAIAHKEFIHIWRDPRSLGMAIAIPMMQLLLFGYALTLDVDKVPLVIWDQSKSPVSREFISQFQGSRYFSLKESALHYGEVEHAIDSGRALVALVIPTDFPRRIASGRSAPVQLIVDGSDSNTATIAMGYAEAVAQSYSQDIAMREIQRMGGSKVYQPLDLRARAWFNTDLQSKNFIIPGLIAVIMNVIAALLTSLTVAREWEMGTMEQLISTPMKPQELVLGKLFPYFAIGLFDVLLAVCMGRFLFDVPLRGSVALIFAMAAIFLIGVLGLGILISIATRNQLLSNQLAMIVTYLPALLLSGYIFAIHNMPPFLQWISYLTPSRYFIKVLKAIFLKGLGIEFLLLETALLTAFAVGMLFLAIVKFKKKLE